MNIAILDIDYLLAFAPLALGHVIVPPISRVTGFLRRELSEEMNQIFQYIYDIITPNELWDIRNIKSLMLDPQKMEGERIATLITYMFIHGDYRHLLGNLTSLFFSGHRVYSSFGFWGMNGIFLLSGVACQLPSQIRRRQDGTKPLLTKVWHFVIPPLSCGSSGGVCGLLGANVVLALWDGISSIEDLGRDSNGGKSLSKTQKAQKLLHAVFLFLGPCATILTMTREWRDVNAVGFGIDNAAHVQGFLFGGALALLGKSCVVLAKSIVGK